MSAGHSHGIVTPITEFQSNIPSLAHFENLRYDEMGPGLGKCSNLVWEDFYFRFINPINLEDYWKILKINLRYSVSFMRVCL